MQHIFSFSTDTLPVSEALFAKLLRSAPHEVPAVVEALSETTRARLALFCNARAHLRDISFTIARTCSETVLMREGAQAGVSLLAQAHSGVLERDVPSRPAGRPISLARMPRTERDARI